MAIKVTVGEQKPQKESPFPKLMVHTDGTITRFKAPHVGCHIYDPNNTLLRSDGLFKELKEIEMHYYTDYNEPITLQNA